MRAVAVVEPNRVEIVDIPAPTPGPYQVLIRTEVACLCNSTDGKLVAGTFPGVESYPLMLGHETVGIVEAVGEKARSFKVGDRVVGGLLFEFAESRYASGWGGFCEYTIANDHDAMIEDGVADEAHGWFEVHEIQRPVAPDIPVEAAVLLCTWREVRGGFGDFHLGAGDDILIYGGGPVGQSFVKFGRLLGLGFIGLVEPVEHKRTRALEMGADRVFAPDSPELEGFIAGRGKPLDTVIDAVGSASIINAALPLIKLGGSIGVYGVISSESITIEKGKGPYNFNLLVHQWPTRSRERAAQTEICDWIRYGALCASEFITHEFPVEDINTALDAVKRGEVIKAILRY